ISGSSQAIPREPVRTISQSSFCAAHASERAVAAASAPSASASTSAGTKNPGKDGAPRMTAPRSEPTLDPVDQGFAIEARERGAIDQGRRSGGAQAQAINGLNCDRAVSGGFAPADLELLQKRGRGFDPAHGLACLGAADLYDTAAA